MCEYNLRIRRSKRLSIRIRVCRSISNLSNIRMSMRVSICDVTGHQYVSSCLQYGYTRTQQNSSMATYTYYNMRATKRFGSTSRRTCNNICVSNNIHICAHIACMRRKYVQVYANLMCN